MLERFKFRITGTTPILMNSPFGMKTPSTGTKIKRVLTADEEAASLLYRNDDGTVFGPAAGFKSGIICASKGMRIGKVGAPGIFRGTIFTPIDAERVLLLDPAHKWRPLTIKDYVVDSRRAVIPSSGAGIVKSRPRFNSWGCICELDVDTEHLPAIDQSLLPMFIRAGQQVGFMDFRPECGGSFGRFRVELMKE